MIALCLSLELRLFLSAQRRNRDVCAVCSSVECRSQSCSLCEHCSSHTLSFCYILLLFIDKYFIIYLWLLWLRGFGVIFICCLEIWGVLLCSFCFLFKLRDSFRLTLVVHLLLTMVTIHIHLKRMLSVTLRDLMFCYSQLDQAGWWCCFNLLSPSFFLAYFFSNNYWVCQFLLPRFIWHQRSQAPLPWLSVSRMELFPILLLVCTTF